MLPALLALALSASAEPVKNPDTYTYLSIGNPDSLDPAWADDTGSMLVIRNVYETLVALGDAPDGGLKPLLSTQVPSRANGLLSKDGLVYTFPVRKGVRFHDGSELTPEDVRYSLLRFMLKDRAGGPSPWLLEPVTGSASTRGEDGRPSDAVYERAARAVRVAGDRVVIRLPRPHPPLLAVLAAWAPVLPRRWAAAQGEWDGSSATWKALSGVKSAALETRAVGTGPWRLERWDRAAQQVVLARNADYWRPPARLSRVVLKAMEEFGARRLALMAGDADVIQADWSQYSQLQGIPGVTLAEGLEVPSVNPALYFTFAVSTAANPNIGSGRLDGDGIPPDFFADLDMRKAWAHCIDYEGFVRDFYRGAGRQARGFLPRGLPGHDPSAPVHRFDLAKAAEHARRAWKGAVWEKGFRMTLAYNSGNSHREALALMLKRNLEGLNPRFKVDVRPYQWPTYLDMLRSRRLPAFMVGWVALFPDPHAAAFMFLHSNGAFPSAQGWSRPRVDALVTSAMREADPARRARLYKDLLRIAYEEVPHVVIVEGTRFRASRDWVKGWAHQPLFPDAPYGGDFYPLYKE